MSSSSRTPRALLSIEDLSSQQARSLIEMAIQLKKGVLKPRYVRPPKVIGLVFLEPSTRTRFSFEVAAHRMGVLPAVFTADVTTSLTKGESLSQTLSNILAMGLDALVVRHPGDSKVESLLSVAKVPIVNAGNGTGEHPTQALLDAMTVFERRGSTGGERILYVGDVEYSRVARSGRALFEKLGAEVAFCAPPDLIPTTSDWKAIRRFEKLSEGLQWCTVCVGLRIQKERHPSAAQVGAEKTWQNYIADYRLDLRNLAPLEASGLILHPGPFVPEVDLSEEILSDSRCAIYDQVTNGVYMRMAIIGEILGIPCS